MDTNNESQNKKRLGRGLNSLFSDSKSQKIDYPKSSAAIMSPAPPVEAKADARLDTKKENAKETAAAGAQAVPKPPPPEVDPESRIWKIAIDKLVPGIYQPRKYFNKEAIEELADSIKQNGLLQPITVRKRAGGGFEIIAGERRWRACQAAGLHEVPAIIKTITDKEALQLAIIENVQREDLDPIEEAEGYQRLMNEFGYSQQEVSEKVGKERSTVANALRLINLPSEVKDLISQKLLSVGHAKSLLSVTDKNVIAKLARESITKGWSVRVLETEIKAKNNTEAKPADNKSLDLDVATKLAKELASQIQKKLGTKTEINYNKGKGQVVIHFYGDDQLTQIYEKLNK